MGVRKSPYKLAGPCWVPGPRPVRFPVQVEGRLEGVQWGGEDSAQGE